MEIIFDFYCLHQEAHQGVLLIIGTSSWYVVAATKDNTQTKFSPMNLLQCMI